MTWANSFWVHSTHFVFTSSHLEKDLMVAKAIKKIWVKTITGMIEDAYCYAKYTNALKISDFTTKESKPFMEWWQSLSTKLVSTL